MLMVRLQRALGLARERARLAAAPLLLAGVSCSFPAPEACTLACGDDGACPGGFECEASSQLCVPRGMTRACTATEIRPNAPEGAEDAGVGGSGPARDAGAGGWGGSAAGSSGAAGAPPVAQLSIVSGALPESACTGAELRHTWRASGGAGPYAWRVVEAPLGLRSGASADEFELGGVPSEPGRLLIELRDASGQTTHAELFVHARPEVSLEELPAICAGQGYAVWLAASGGDPDDYSWSAEVLGGDGAAATLEELGLRLEGSRLTGEAVASGEEAPIRLSLEVRDSHCRSSAVELELQVFSPDSEQCPSIDVVDGPSDGSLPPPCLGGEYEEALSVAGGQEPYVWSQLAAPPGLHFDADTATVRGIAEGDGVLTVEVTDASERTTRKSYAVEARDRCWLAFVASEPAPARLALVDARRSGRQPETARRMLPEAGTPSEAVVDFRFSPDGRFIAYRLRAGSGPFRVELARLSNGRSRGVPGAGSAVAYGWSQDSSTLALALDSGGSSLLAAVDISGVDASSVDPGVALDGMRVLTPVAAPLPDSPLSWSADGRLAFFAREPGPERRLVSALLGRSGFAAASLRGAGFSGEARLLAARAGVFVAEPATGLHEFFAADSGVPTAHAAGIVIAPSGAWAGLARGGALQLFRPDRASSPGVSPSLEAEGCGTLLAWAGARERVACLDSSAPGSLTWFDVSGAGDVSVLEPLRGDFADASAGHVGQRRALSPSGRWFAFATRDDLHVARVEPGPPRLHVALASSLLGAPVSLLSFSPDESFLAVGAANTLGLLDLGSGSTSFVLLSPSAVFDEFCSERFVDGAAAWCGAPSPAPDVSWSSASDMIAFRSSLGTLQLVDLSRAREGFVAAPTSPDACLEGCSSSSSARFQP